MAFLDPNWIALIIFVIAFSFFLYKKRQDIQLTGLFPVFYFVMYRTKFGLKWMKRFSEKWPRFLRWNFVFGIYTGFLGMIVISYLLISNIVKLLLVPETQPAAQLVLPLPIKGVFYIPFIYWIIALFVIAIIHEFSHGIASNLFKIPVKSSGFAFLGLIFPVVPAAFVEPDEKKLSKAHKKEQLAVLAAGAYSNILTAIPLILLLGFAIYPFIGTLFQPEKIVIGALEEGAPLYVSGASLGEEIISVNGQEIVNLDDIYSSLKDTFEGDSISLKTNESEYFIILAKHPEKEHGYAGFTPQPIGSEVTQSAKVTYGLILPEIFLRLSKLIEIIAVLSLGVGIFNLLPLGPLDGGKMFKIAMEHLFNKHGYKIWKYTSLFFLGVLIISLSISFFK